jgi:hypothetical protein
MKKGEMYFDYVKMCSRRRWSVAERVDMIIATVVAFLIAGIFIFIWWKWL